MEDDNTLLAESFRALRVKLKYLTDQEEMKVIGVTSSWSGEGKSFCSANLAYSLSKVNAKILLIDMDFRKPSQEAYYPGEYQFGLADYLLGHCLRKNIIYKTEIKNLHIIPVGKPYYNPLDLLEGNKLGRMIRDLRKRYDYIILDTPPIGQTSDYFILNRMIDYTLVYSQAEIHQCQFPETNQ